MGGQLSRLPADAVAAAALLMVDPAGLGGAVVRARASPQRDEWLALLGELDASGAPMRRLPSHIADDRLLGGLDLTATLVAGRPVAVRGLLAECDGGILVVPMAERLEAQAAGRLAGVIDRGEVVLDRDGVTDRARARIAVVALDEGEGEDEHTPTALAERLAFHIDLDAPDTRGEGQCPIDAAQIRRARLAAPGVILSDEALHALSAAAVALGVGTVRAELLAARVARANAALAGRSTVADEDVVLACRLVLAPRATRLPDDHEDPAPDRDMPDAGARAQGNGQREPEPDDAGPEGDKKHENLDSVAVAAAASALPKGLLEALAQGVAGRSNGVRGRRAGRSRKGMGRGRPVGSRPGKPHTTSMLDVLATLTAAAPWQRLRNRDHEDARCPAGEAPRSLRLRIGRDDFRIRRRKHRSETATIFAVDASGSTALARLAEAKGAVELLLAECYVRRDQVALVAFGGRGVQVVLPPTRSLVRAKRCLAGLAGGGGTPLPSGLAAVADLAAALRRRGMAPTIVVLTDGRANVARSGSGGRAAAQAEALAVGREIAAAGLPMVLVDTSLQPGAFARELAASSSARYLALPNAEAHVVSEAVRRVKAEAATATAC